MSSIGRCVTIAMLLLGLGLGPANAADHVVPGTQLKLRRTAIGGALTLVLRDVTAIPAPGSGDDPSLAGMTVTVFGMSSRQQATLSAPPGVGRPGWKVRPAPRVTYTYTDSSVPNGSTNLQAALLRSGTGLRLRARSAGLDLAGGEAAVGVRVEWGSERVCTIFDDGAIRRSQPGVFVGAKADAPAIASCDDASFVLPRPCAEDGLSCSGTCPGDGACGGNSLIGCTCVSPHQPCGGSDPVCNGECPAGEQCGAIASDPFPSCACLPAGSTPCGDVYPSCGGGDCPAGTSCYADTIPIPGPFGFEVDICACYAAPPTDACGGTCPAGWTCVGPRPNFPAACMPPSCEGGSGSPACDGTCSQPNTSCVGISSFCFCLETCSGGSPAPTCGGTCTTPNTTCTSVGDQCLCGAS